MLHKKRKLVTNKKCKTCFWNWYNVCVNPFNKNYGDKIIFIDSRKCKQYITEEKYNEGVKNE